MTVLRFAGISGFAIAFLAACLPPRDNPADPKGTPALETSVSPPVGGRTTLFALRAEPIRPERLEFAWDLDDPRWDPDADTGDFEAHTGTSGLLSVTLALTSSMLAASGFDDGVGAVVREVRVRATGRDGHFVVQRLSVVLQNAAPQVDAGSDVIFSPTNEVVTLDACGGFVGGCSSSDPDGDPLTYSWEALGSSPPALTLDDAAGRRVSFAHGTRESIFRITASDGLATSTGFVTAFPGRQIWVNTSAPARLYRMFSDFAVRSNFRFGGSTFPFSFTTRVAANDGDLWLAEPGSGGPAVVRRFSTGFTHLDGWAVADEGPRSLTALGDGSACAAHKTATASFPGSPGAFLRFTAGGPTPARFTDANPSLTVDASDGTGDCWTIGSQIGRITPAGAFSVVDAGPFGADPNEPAAYAATVTPDGALWVVLADPILIDGFTYYFRNLYRVAPGGSALEKVGGNAYYGSPILPDPLDASGSAVIVGFAGYSFRVDPSGNAEPSDLPLPPVAYDLTAAYEAAGQAIWLSDEEGSYVRRFTRLQGEWVESAAIGWDEIGAGQKLRALSVDPVSGVAFAAFSKTVGGASVIARLPAHLRRSEAVPFAAEAGAIHVAGDPNGGVWIAREGSRVVEKRNDRGDLTASYPQSQPPNAIASSGSGGAWYSMANVPLLVKLDGRSSSVAATTEVPAGDGIASFAVGPGAQACIAGSAGAYRMDLATALFDTVSSPSATASAASPSGGCWYFTTGRADWIPAGNTVPAGTYSAAFSGTGAADPVDDSVWLPTGSSVVHVSTAGAVLATVPVAATRAAVLSCATVDAPTCRDGWAIDPATSTVTRYDAVGSLETFVLPLGSPADITVVP